MIDIFEGDNRAHLARLIEMGVRVHSVVTDPPYGLTSVTKRFGGENAKPVVQGTDGAFARASKGFMGKTWDGSGIERDPEFWRLIYEILLPGGYCVAFSGSRTGHWQACAMEMAGFVMHPMLGWLTGQGFPKAHSVDRYRGDLFCGCETPTERDMRSVRDADVSTSESASEEREEILQHGLPQQGLYATVDGLQTDVWGGKSSVEGRRYASQEAGELRLGAIRPLPPASHLHGANGRLRDGTQSGHGELDRSTFDTHGNGASQKPQSADERQAKPRIIPRQSQSQDGRAWPNCGRCGKPRVPRGLAYGGQALKPALEPIYVGQKPFAEKNGALNLLKHGVGAINIGACRVQRADGDTSGWAVSGSKESENRAMSGKNYAREAKPDNELGRHPANLLHDGSPEVIALFPQTTSGVKQGGHYGRETGVHEGGQRKDGTSCFGDTGSAARFFNCFPLDVEPVFYQPKATKADRAGSKHPTVKPIALMRWLCRLVTPCGGTILDPFAGSGTTGEAARQEGFDCILMEAEPDYAAFLKARFRRDDPPGLAGDIFG